MFNNYNIWFNSKTIYNFFKPEKSTVKSCQLKVRLVTICTSIPYIDDMTRNFRHFVT